MCLVQGSEWVGPNSRCIWFWTDGLSTSREGNIPASGCGFILFLQIDRTVRTQMSARAEGEVARASAGGSYIHRWREDASHACESRMSRRREDAEEQCVSTDGSRMRVGYGVARVAVVRAGGGTTKMHLVSARRGGPAGMQRCKRGRRRRVCALQPCEEPRARMEVEGERGCQTSPTCQ